jgi:LPXTG-site transpeptidase (sortase) family protein
MKKFFFAVSGVFVFVYVLTHVNNVQASAAAVEETRTAIETLAEAETEETEETNSSSEVMEDEVAGSEEADDVCQEHIGDTFNIGDAYGIIDILGTESAITVGADSDSLEHQAAISPYSTEDSAVILGHSYKDNSVFGTLYLLTDGDIVTITTMDGALHEYVVVGTQWVTETDYNTEAGVAEVFDGSADLKLITCQTKSGEKGRLIVSCISD